MQKRVTVNAYPWLQIDWSQLLPNNLLKFTKHIHNPVVHKTNERFYSRNQVQLILMSVIAISGFRR